MFGAAELILLAIIALPVIALVDIVKSNFKDSKTKLMWVIIILLLPLFGTILYFAVGRGQKLPQ